MKALAVLLAGMLLGSGASRNEGTAGSAGPRFIAAAPPGTIVFSSARYDTQRAFADLELHVVRPDGTGLTQITKSRGVVTEPRWSPDGNNLAFLWTPDTTNWQLWMATADGKNLRMLVDLNRESIPGLSWSPDGTQLAYTNNGSIRILDLATGSHRRLVKGSWPAWSNVGGSSVVVYTSGRFVGEGSRTSLRVIDPDGTHDRPIVFGSDDNPSDLKNASEASAEPTSSRIAFVNSANNYQGDPAQWNEQIYVTELIDGDPVRTTPPRLISHSPTNDHWPPAWSKQPLTADDGSCIVWTTDGKKFGTGHLVLTSSRENNPGIVDLTKSRDAYDIFPDWHPDARCAR